MATTKIGVQTVGAAWAAALALWVDFANGVYTSWSYSLSILNSGYSIEVTVGLSGGGTDVHKIQPLDTNYNNFMPLTYVFNSPGWRTMPQVALPVTVPGGGSVDTAFTNGPWALRASILGSWCNVSGSHDVNDQYSMPEGIQTTIWRQIWKGGNLAFVDVIGIMWSTPTGLDSVTGQPTDFIGSAPPISMSSGGGSVDLTPLVAAVQDLVTQEVDWTANAGGSTWSLHSKVRVP